MDNSHLLDFARKMCTDHGISSRADFENNLSPLADALEQRGLMERMFPGSKAKSVVSSPGEPISGYDDTVSLRPLSDGEIQKRITLLKELVDGMKRDPKRFYKTANANFLETQNILGQHYTSDHLQQVQNEVLRKCTGGERLSSIEELVKVMIELKPLIDNPPSKESSQNPPAPASIPPTRRQADIPTPSFPQQQFALPLPIPPRQPPRESSLRKFLGNTAVWTIAGAAALSCALHLTGSFHDIASGIKKALDLPSMALAAKHVMIGFYSLVGAGFLLEILGRPKARSREHQIAAGFEIPGSPKANGEQQAVHPLIVQKERSEKRNYAMQKLADIGRLSDNPQKQAQYLQKAMVADEGLFDCIDTLYYSDSDEMNSIMRNTGIRSVVVGVIDQLLGKVEVEIMMKRYALLASLAPHLPRRMEALGRLYQTDKIFSRKLDELFINPAKATKLRNSSVSYRSAQGQSTLSGEEFYQILKGDYENMRGMVGA
jgi:hypothetical protein